MSLPSVAERVESGINTPCFYIDTSLYLSITAHDHASCIVLAASIQASNLKPFCVQHSLCCCYFRRPSLDICGRVNHSSGRTLY